MFIHFFFCNVFIHYWQNESFITQLFASPDEFVDANIIKRFSNIFFFSFFFERVNHFLLRKLFVTQIYWHWMKNVDVVRKCVRTVSKSSMALDHVYSMNCHKLVKKNERKKKKEKKNWKFSLHRVFYYIKNIKTIIYILNIYFVLYLKPCNMFLKKTRNNNFFFLQKIFLNKIK